jgi:hypothetical protein
MAHISEVVGLLEPGEEFNRTVVIVKANAKLTPDAGG